MPTYTYQCQTCGETQDVFHAISAKPRIKCEACGGSCKKLLGTGAGIIFKGSGFYETDYKKAGQKATATSDGGKKDSSSAATETKSDKKKESSTDSKKASTTT